MTVIHESVVCTGCGCLCDDLDVTLNGNQVLEVANVCRWGVSRFFGAKKFQAQKERCRLKTPQVRHRGRLMEVAYEEALAQAAAILTRARRPLIYGLTNAGCAAQEAALKLAKRLGARLEPADLAFMAPYYQSITNHGGFLAPLEVIRDQVDAMLFWGANPMHSAPRHLVRYSAFARGRFTERGFEDRQVAAVDLFRSELAEFCHLFVQITPDQELALINDIITRLTQGAPPEQYIKGAAKLADFLLRASYVAVFCGRGVTYGHGGAILDRLGELAAYLNQDKPCVLLPLSTDFNSAGLYHLLLRELSGVGAPDFATASHTLHPTPVDFTSVDAILVTGADLWWFLSEAGRQDLLARRVPIVQLSPYSDRTSTQAEVLLPVALTGVETDDVAYRLDGLPLLLKKILPPDLPPDHQVLADLQLFL